jgi:hydrogenase maturation protease
MSTVVIGLGNPVRADDGVGLAVVRFLRDHLPKTAGVEVTELWAGGLRLAEAMTGFDRAIIVDALTTSASPAGTVRRMALSDLGSARNITCLHDTSLPVAVELWRRLGLQMPHQIDIWGIEARDTESFSESLTEPVARAVPEAGRAILCTLKPPRELRRGTVL